MLYNSLNVNTMEVTFQKDIDKKNFEERILYLDMDIDFDVMDFVKTILFYNMEDRDKKVEDRKPIKLYIFSYGGSVDMGNALIDAIELSKTPVYTYNFGIAASMGALISLAGHKRFCFSKARYLIHQGQAQVGGSIGALLDNVEDIKRTEEEVKEYILSHTKIDKKLYNKKVKDEWFLNAKEAIKLGVADEILEDIDILF